MSPSAHPCGHSRVSLVDASGTLDPANGFVVDFDTGSSDFFLPGSDCTQNCQGHRVFETAQSATAIDQDQSFSIEFADGSSVKGEVFEDTVSLAGLTASQQAIVAATQYSSGFAIQNSPPDGLLGLAFISISETGRSPVFETLVLQNQTTSPVFGFTLLDNGGELFLGGTDTSAFSGSLTFAPLTLKNPPAFWEIVVYSASVGKQTVVSTAQDAIVDTGTTLLIVDPASASAIYSAIPGARNAANVLGEGFFTIPCNEVPSNVGFTIAGKTFTLSPDTLNFGLLEEGSNECVGGIMGANEGKPSCPSVHCEVRCSFTFVGFWIFGDVFLRNLYAGQYHTARSYLCN